MSSLGIFFQQLFLFLQKIVPTVISAFIWGYSTASKKTAELESKLRDLALKQKYNENKDAIEKKFDGRSDDDIAADVLSGAINSDSDKTNKE